MHDAVNRATFNIRVDYWFMRDNTVSMSRENEVRIRTYVLQID